MTGYEVLILRKAQRELFDLPAGEYERVRDSIRSLAQVPRPPGCLKLTGRDGWRIRVGVVRVIYEIDDNQQRVTVLHVGHRRDVYR
ncbi:MAG: type II toxin-antitoxin system RelE/ParE family toxin [Chloroflexi bacterium]|nr:type II toxin-antitoxin system RelE/ParE family toxin [Chloroflexota bacterium]MCH8350558.1 type II toxin-antitoxin system RelE/ParE family toxin [Chloroflexota bacterium]MCI0793530.1 type II toxin-antitoxin system RelE/ParE family toxin [Chloroflexota bacterium]MCI0858729.1 type II toxin-antitoxin system RelE/ParE family toxin [Chloroflexota bacterium]